MRTYSPEKKFLVIKLIGMKKSFYKIAMLVIVSGLITVSCKKETPAPEAKAPVNASNSKVIGGSESSAPSTPYQDTHSPGGCPGHK